MASPKEFAPDFVLSAKEGDRQATEAIVRRLRPILRAYFIRRIGLKPDVEDLIQNTLVRVYNGLRDLQRPDRFMGFAMKAALFEVQDFYRGRYSAKETTYDPESPPTMIQHPKKTGLQVDLERALTVLTPKAREIIELREYGYRYKEIAEMVGTTEAAVKMQVKRAFERLRRVLVA
ncbi:MAG: sigma-70 family RNA polymerase sigma factor [Bacteroidota bacterium]